MLTMTSSICLLVCLFSVVSVKRVEDQCELPGCTKPKQTQGTRVHHYCSREHFHEDYPNLGTQSAQACDDYTTLHGIDILCSKGSQK